MSRWDDPYWDYEEPPDDDDHYPEWEDWMVEEVDSLEAVWFLSEDGGKWERVMPWEL